MNSEIHGLVKVKTAVATPKRIIRFGFRDNPTVGIYDSVNQLYASEYQSYTGLTITSVIN